MAEHGTIQSYLDLSQEYLAAAKSLASQELTAPAYHSALHALELAVKAALATRLSQVPHTHNVAGLFGREFRGSVGAEVCARIGVLLHAYDAPRYPEWDLPEDLLGDLAFVERIVAVEVPRLIRGME